MKFLLPIYFLLFLFGSTLSHANNPLFSKVDRSKLGENETLQLTISYQDARVSENPDLRSLENQFEIISQSENSSYQFINGRKSSVKEWHYTLLPKKSGKLLIPSFKLKGYFSDSIIIDVLPENSSSSADQKSDLFIESFVDKKEAYVQEMLTWTIRINTAIRIARPELGEMTLPDFIIHKIGETDYQKTINGRRYHVIEYKYALFPNKSGNYLIEKQRYRIAQIINNRPRSLFDISSFNNTQAKFLTTPEISLVIKPQPVNAGTNWLPASEVTIKDNLSNTQSIEAGTPITRSITITAADNTASVIAPLQETDIPNLKIYPESPVLDDQFTRGTIVGSRVENMAIIPVQAGTYRLPEISVRWWDTNIKEHRTAVLPERVIEVTPSSSAQQSTPMNTSTTTPLSQEEQTLVYSGTSPDNSSYPDNKPSYFWVYSTLLFASLWLGTLAYLLLTQKLKQANSDSDKIEESTNLKSAVVQLKKSCAEGDPVRIRESVILWGQAFYRDSNLTSLQQVSAQVANEKFQQAVEQLDKALFMHKTDSGKDGQLIDFSEIIPTQSPAKTSPPRKLSPLYPKQ